MGPRRARFLRKRPPRSGNPGLRALTSRTLRLKAAPPPPWGDPHGSTKALPGHSQASPGPGGSPEPGLAIGMAKALEERQARTGLVSS